MKAGTAGLKHLPVFSTGTAGSATKEKRDHVPHVTCWNKPSLPTCHSYTHFVSLSGTAGSRQGLPAARQARTHNGIQWTEGKPGLLTRPVHSGAHLFDAWVTGPVVDCTTRLNKREMVAHVENATQLNAAARPRGVA